MKRILCISGLLIIGTFAFGQSYSDSITVERVFGGYQFYQNNQRLSVNKLVKAMRSNEIAYSQVKSARSANTFATILGYAGGFMLGWPIGTSLGGGDPNWTLAAIGGGLIVVAIPINHSFNKKARQAIGTFNEGLQTSSFWQRSELRFTVSGNTLGLKLKF